MQRTEDGFLAGMRKDRKTDRLLRDAPDRRDYLLTFAVGDSGIHYDDAARAGDKGDVCCTSTIFRVIPPPVPGRTYTPGATMTALGCDASTRWDGQKAARMPMSA
jgi:hypothetical protein